MAIFTTRRLIGDVLHIVGRSFEDCSQEIQEWAGKITRQVQGGIPGGFNNTTPTTIQAGVAADAGAESDGWMAAGAVLAIETGAPTDLGEANAEGSGTALARAAHVHKILVRVAKAGATIGTRKRLNFIDGAGMSVAVVDDVGSDEVDITITATPAPDPADLEYLSWVL